MNTANYYELLEIDREASAQEIRRAYAKKIREYPNETHPEMFQLIRKAYETLSNPELKKKYDSSLQQDGRYSQLLESALVDKQNNNFAAASVKLDRMRRDYPDDETVQYHLAECYLFLNRFDDARQMVSQLILKDPNHVDYIFLLGVIYEKQNNFDRAADQYEKAIRLNPEDSNLYLNASYCYAQVGEYESSIEILEEKLKRQPERHYDFPLLMELYVVCYLKGDRFYEAQVLKRMERTPRTVEEEIDLISMIQNACDNYQYRQPFLEPLIDLVDRLNQRRDRNTTDWIEAARKELELNLRGYQPSNSYQEVTATADSYAPAGQYERPLGFSIIIGIIFSFMATPIVGIIAGVIYYYYSERIKAIIKGIVAIFFILMILGFILSLL